MDLVPDALYDADGDLYRLLIRKCGSPESAESRLRETGLQFGISGTELRPTLAALALVSLGVSSETVSRMLPWEDFESFCADIALAQGYRVLRNVTLRRPRAQIDFVARSESVIAAMDCKHWSRLGPSAVRTLALAQLRRSRLLRQTLKTERLPIVSAIITLYDNLERFVEGVAIVPVSVLPNFLQTLEGLTEALEVV
jgi:hypothetical protein